MSDDLVDRLRRWVHAVDAGWSSDLMDEAADEIERLRHRLRFADAVIRSGDAATLTDSERKAVKTAMNAYGSDNANPECAAIEATLWGLLERTK